MKRFYAFILIFAVALGSCVKNGVRRARDLDPKFCSQWNPDFDFNKRNCCGSASRDRKKKWSRCTPTRKASDFCKEMTLDQTTYTEMIESGQYDVLKVLEADKFSNDQAYCSVNDGFLAFGKRAIPTHKNRLRLLFPGRCTNFGTDGMVGMLEWTGREIAKSHMIPAYSGVHLLIGDISAPRGGCVWGLSGRMGHLSHTNGQDVDLGFLTAEKYKNSPVYLHQKFDAKLNWWMIKKIFDNPYACVKYIFLDQRHIQSLSYVAEKDRSWKALKQYIRHSPGHQNHLHVRIGSKPGLPGCFNVEALDSSTAVEDDVEDSD